MSHRETLFFHCNYKTLSQTSSYIFWNKFQISSPLRATVKFTHPKILTVMVVQHALTNPDGWEELYYFRFHFGILAVVPGERNEYFILSKFHIAFITNFISSIIILNKFQTPSPFRATVKFTRLIILTVMEV